MIGDGSAARSADSTGIEAERASLDDRLRDILDLPSDDPSRTWGARVAEALVAAAARGDARSWGVLFRRAGLGAASEAAGPAVDDETARRVLEAVLGRVDDHSLD